MIFCDGATLSRETIVEEKPSHLRTLQAREEQITSVFSLFALPWWPEWTPWWPVWILCRSAGNCCGLGQSQLVGRRANSKTRWASPWKRTCLWRRRETSLMLYLLTAGGVHEGPWPAKGPWLSLHCSARALSGPHTNAKGFLGQHWCDPALITWRKTWAYLSLSSRPDSFSSQGWLLCRLANPWWFLLAPTTQSTYSCIYIMWPMSGNKTAWTAS